MTARRRRDAALLEVESVRLTVMRMPQLGMNGCEA